MRVRFTKDFNYTPSQDYRIMIEYKAGHELTVRREAGEAAIAAGKAEEIGADPLGHDLDGRKGGSLPKAKKSDAEA